MVFWNYEILQYFVFTVFCKFGRKTLQVSFYFVSILVGFKSTKFCFFSFCYDFTVVYKNLRLSLHRIIAIKHDPTSRALVFTCELRWLTLGNTVQIMNKDPGDPGLNLGHPQAFTCDCPIIIETF